MGFFVIFWGGRVFVFCCCCLFFFGGEVGWLGFFVCLFFFWGGGGGGGLQRREGWCWVGTRGGGAAEDRGRERGEGKREGECVGVHVCVREREGGRYWGEGGSGAGRIWR